MTRSPLLAVRHSLLLAAPLSLLLAACATTPGAPARAAGTPADPALAALSRGSLVTGFRAEALYVDAADQPVGGRFVHSRSGFTLDLLRVETAPQGYIWVNTFLTSDRGEPHTQEHLLLGKGNKGRSVSNLESYSLVNSSAFVTQWRTQYHFNAPAGPAVFFDVLDAQLDALLNPDYTDEEIRREVRNIGVAQDPDGTLRLEEKGTVYNEMVSSFERASSRLFREAGQLLYGADHPLALSAGGWPAAIREMTPEHIRAFHRATYQLGNMGIIASLPRSVPLGVALQRFDSILTALHRETGETRRPFPTEADLPPPTWAPEGELRYAPYPHLNAQQPSPLAFAWRPERRLSLDDEILLGLFLSNFAGDATTNLYRVFVDTRTREIDLGAQAVGSFAGDVGGHAVFVQLANVAPALATEERIQEARRRILLELERIAGWEEGSPELREFNTRLRDRIVAFRREQIKFSTSPPGFGQRAASTRWPDVLHRLSRTSDFRRDVTLSTQLNRIEQMLGADRNLWRDALQRWQLLDREPYAVLAVPSAELVRREEAERRERLRVETEALLQRFGAADPQEAIRRYAAEYDSATAELDQLAAQAPGARFLEQPPLSLDEPLDWRMERVGPGVPLVSSRFPGLPSTTTGLALSLHPVAEDDLLYLSILPTLLTEVGVIEDGVPVSYEEMRGRLRNEVLSLSSYFSTNPHTGRVELVVRGAGNDLGEARRALHWMGLALYTPNWREENLPRIRDVVDQALAGLRTTMQRPEETWVENPAAAYRYQTDRLYLAAGSFLTRNYNALRLRWLLRTPGEGEAAALDHFLLELSSAAETADRDGLRALTGSLQRRTDQVPAPASHRAMVAAFAALPPGAAAVAADIARDLELTIADVPDASLAADWRQLVERIRLDLATPPAHALAGLDRARRQILLASGARMFMISSPETRLALEGELGDLLVGLGDAEVRAPSRANTPLVLDRLRRRAPEADAIFVGLVNPNTQGGVFLHTAPLAGYRTTDRVSLLNFLAAQLYSGGGAHSMFMKTWAAGLAYSNGLRNSPATGLLTYYAERVPELPQTMRFVIDELRASPRDADLTEYAMAMAFRGIRAAESYESRGEAMANDIADRRDPETVQGFLSAILALRDEPSLAQLLHGRMEHVYGRVLPGYGPPSPEVPGGVFMVIGPESQLRLWEDYLRTAEGPNALLHRLYPRDFWMVAPETATARIPSAH